MSGQAMGRGVLRPDAAASVVELRRHPPAPELAPYVEFYWNPRWDLRGRPDHEQKVLAHPSVHLVLEDVGPLVYGVQRALFVRVLRGAGQVFGVKFRPGGFRPFTVGPVVDLLDRTVPAEQLLSARFGADAGARVASLSPAVLALDDLGAMAALADRFLLGLLPSLTPDPRVAEVADLVARITGRPHSFRVDDLARQLGIPVRRLQRLFAQYVGASPKWVLRRARLHEAAARADEGPGVDWAALAADLGYADQAHLTRDFAAAVGTPPARYAGGRVAKP
ncbi:helix-turn-helix domain-containing protein [Streptomyces sp. HPF1205]|uniref:helix-turn-helix domain-containing protein n=1 Tax=Streptomyces sp. HPF1205 TaxID=2873262 RepID=UPI001CED4D5D|nr:helix-turn-helix domain-containing protein [Streptomyces sp. HPF1205]